MVFRAVADVPTQSGSRYLQQLCKHWSHTLVVEFTASEGKVIFPANARGATWPGDGVLRLEAAAEHLRCEISATSNDQLEHLKGVVARHLDRFAFREAPLAFAWQGVGGS